MEHNIPDRWVIIKLPDNIYKVFAMWQGGYLSGDAWRLNSGITRVAQDDKAWYFYGHSGSCYRCFKDRYGITGYGMSVLSNIKDKVDIDILEPREDWSTLL